jgi:glycosyltransferase involved in cell wall biosynthesis
MVGPVTKIDPASLPRAANLRYLGQQPYARLPELMACFDVALMPFALNESTVAISPTKTLEYFAAGLPVVSTRVPDVVNDYEDLVVLADDGAEFALACRRLAQARPADLLPQLDEVLRRREWDGIASRMSLLLDMALSNRLEEEAAGA